MKEVGRRRRRRTQLLDDLTNRRRYWELKEEAEDKKDGNDRVSHELKEEITVIFHKLIELLIGNTFKYHVSCTDGKISVRINLLFYLYLPPSSHLIYACFCPVGLSLL